MSVAAYDGAHARDAAQKLRLDAKGRHLLLDPRVQEVDVRIEMIEATKLETQQESVVVLDASFEGEFELGHLLAQRALGEAGHLLRARLSRQKSPQHELARGAEDVAENARELDVGGLEELEQAVPLRAAYLDQLAAIADQVSQLADVLGRHLRERQQRPRPRAAFAKRPARRRSLLALGRPRRRAHPSKEAMQQTGASTTGRPQLIASLAWMRSIACCPSLVAVARRAGRNGPAPYRRRQAACSSSRPRARCPPAPRRAVPLEVVEAITTSWPRLLVDALATRGQGSRQPRSPRRRRCHDP